MFKHAEKRQQAPTTSLMLQAAFLKGTLTLANDTGIIREPYDPVAQAEIKIPEA